MPVNPRTPVLVGYGQINHREDRVAEENTLEPVDLMAAAAREAADSRVLEAVDAISVVNLFSARYRDPGLLLGQRIGADHP
ncbi:MAG: acetyl-CoA C-acetyltransferase, partial [Mycobacterium sp.]|nr:acetyl-CoA C-acetyltransferase [Mycobacterium sp.]